MLSHFNSSGVDLAPQTPSGSLSADDSQDPWSTARGTDMVDFVLDVGVDDTVIEVDLSHVASVV